MKRVCSECGVFFQGSDDSILCPTCKEQKLKDVIRPRSCIGCGQVFDGGPRARWCPSCRILAKKEALARYRKSGTSRKLGSTDTCQLCGREYIVKSGRQKYCSDACSRKALLKWQQEHKKATRNPKKIAAMRVASRSKRQKVCKYCLRPFWSDKSTDLCSAYCREKQLQINRCEADIRRGRKRNLRKYLDEREEYREARGKEGKNEC